MRTRCVTEAWRCSFKRAFNDGSQKSGHQNWGASCATDVQGVTPDPALGSLWLLPPPPHPIGRPSVRPAFNCGVWDHFLRLPHFLDRSWLYSYLYPVHLLSIQPCFGSLQWVPGPWILDHWASPPIWLSIGFHLLSMDSLSRKRSRHNICESGRSPLNGKVSMKASVVKKGLSTIFICGICTKLKFKVTLGEFDFHEITNEQLEMVPLWDQYLAISQCLSIN